MYGESQTKAAVEVEDYGLSEMRRLSMPGVSGLAAIFGVVLVQLLPLAGSVFTQTPPGNLTTPSLVGIFDLSSNSKNLVGLLVAAVFGLTPGLLFTRLQQQAENYAADLKTSEATQAPSP